jgi:hypothetical protein
MRCRYYLYGIGSYDSRIPLHLFFTIRRFCKGLRRNRRNPFHFLALHSKSIQGIPSHSKF